jgi:hypothetical protein
VEQHSHDHADATQWVGFRDALRLELRHHLPFTVIVTAVTAVAASVAVRTWPALVESGASFEGAHVAHVFVSAVATTAVGSRQRGGPVLAAGLGIAGSIVFCTLSDILLPYAGALAFGTPVSLDVEVLHAPVKVGLAAVAGAAGGFAHMRRLSIYSHSAHVLVSSLASVLYVHTHAAGAWADWAHAPEMAAVLFFSVFLPCCMSDLVMPVACTHCDFRGRDNPAS